MVDLKGDVTKAVSSQPEDNLILVDCSDTVFGPDFNNPDYNASLIAFLIEMKKVGYQVQFFSDDPMGSIFLLTDVRMQLEQDNIDFKFGKVARKADYAGKKAFIVIDNDHTSHEVQAQALYSPQDDRIARALRGIDAQFGKRTLN